MDINTFPNSQEYWGPSAMPFFGNVQLRWSPIRGEQHNLIFTLEDPGASNDPNTPAVEDALSERNIREEFPLPDYATDGSAGMDLRAMLERVRRDPRCSWETARVHTRAGRGGNLELSKSMALISWRCWC